jgi:hypothetical protein
MTARLHALVTVMLLGAASAAHAKGSDSPLTVFVTAAPTANVAGDTPDGAETADKLAGSVDDVKKAITGAGIRGRRKHLVLVDSPAQAQLVVEVRSRRGAFGGLGLFNRFYFVVFAIKPGAKLAPEQLAALPRDHRQGGLVAKPVTQDDPEWVFEASGRGSWKVAGAVAASMVDRFAEVHAPALATSVADAQ